MNDYQEIEAWINAELEECAKADWQDTYKWGYAQALYAIMARMDKHKRLRQPMSEPKITNVYNWANGMTMVFDQFGEQMPEFQGPTEEMMPKIRAAGFRDEVPITQWPRDGFR